MTSRALRRAAADPLPGPLADAFGKYLDALKASFGTSDFAELIRLSISAGFEQAKFYAAQFAATNRPAALAGNLTLGIAFKNFHRGLDSHSKRL